jgi:CRP/FNR family transcriptional regulator/CRP/FNR family cyclic AMP-dependent transcriptional regulator
MHEVDLQRVEQLLTRADLLSGLEPVQRRALTGLVRLRRFAPRDVIVWVGEPPEAIFLVLSGFVKAVGGGQHGREVLFSVMGEGEVIGELAVLDGQPRSATLIALEPTELAIIDREPLLALLKGSPDFSLKLMGVLASRLRRLSEHCESISTTDASARLAKVLLSLATKHGVPTADGILVPVRLSQQDLGNMVGVTRERVNHLLREWIGRAILRQEAGRFVVSDVSALKRLLGP